MKKYDAIIIGFGKGGKSLAAYLSNQNQNVALIEKDSKMYGGTCINVGCIPSKSILKNAHRAPKTNFDLQSEHYRNAIKEKNQLTQRLRQKNYEKLDVLKDCDLYDGVAHFVDNHTIQVVQKNQTETLLGKQIFINTGSIPTLPDIQGIENNPHIVTSASLMDIEDLPKRLSIIGAGYIGLEFASIYASFGSEVTLFNKYPQLLKNEDRDIVEVIEQNLLDKDVILHHQAHILKIENNTIHYQIQDKEFTQEADLILIATGRNANTKDLLLENTDVLLDHRQAIVVNEKNQTSVDHIYAMGDVLGKEQFTYTSFDDFRIVKAALINESYTRTLRKAVPYSVFLDPAYARVGLNETMAKEQGYNYKVVKLPAMAIPKAQVLQNPKGLLKAIVDLDTNKILGCMLICEESYEMINIVKTAMDLDANYQQLRDQIFTHPTMSEALNDLFSLV